MLSEKVAEAREDGRQAGVRGLDLRYCPHDAHTVASLMRRIAWYQGHAAGERDVVGARDPLPGEATRGYLGKPEPK